MADKNTLFDQRAPENYPIPKYKQLQRALDRVSRTEEELGTHECSENTRNKRTKLRSKGFQYKKKIVNTEVKCINAHSDNINISNTYLQHCQ